MNYQIFVNFKLEKKNTAKGWKTLHMMNSLKLRNKKTKSYKEFSDNSLNKQIRGLGLDRYRRDSLNRRIRQMVGEYCIELSEFKVLLQAEGGGLRVWFVKYEHYFNEVSLEAYMIEERQKEKRKEYIVYFDFEKLKMNKMNSNTRSIVFNLHELEKNEKRGWELGRLRRG